MRELFFTCQLKLIDIFGNKFSLSIGLARTGCWRLSTGDWVQSRRYFSRVAGVPRLVGCFWLTGLTPSPSPEERGMPPFMQIVGISKSNVSGS